MRPCARNSIRRHERHKEDVDIAKAVLAGCVIECQTYLMDRSAYGAWSTQAPDGPYTIYGYTRAECARKWLHKFWKRESDLEYIIANRVGYRDGKPLSGLPDNRAEFQLTT